MRFCRFDVGFGPRHGRVADEYVIDLANHDDQYPLEAVRLLAPVQPRKYLAIGLNYADHIAESGMDTPGYPVFFNKQVTCVVGPDDDVHMPRVSGLLDYEGELAVVIATRCRHVPVAHAHEVIAGYTIANDVSVRDWQVRSPTMTMGKSFDTHGPLGPWVVTPDELGDPHDLKMELRVDGEVRQESHSSRMSVTIPQILSNFSALGYSAGDVLSTGTVAGVAGFKSEEERRLLYLKPGDVIEAEIERIGVLRNPVVSWQEGHGTPPLPRVRPWGD